MANNSNDSKKYISLNRLSNFLDNIKAKYSQIGHKHTMSDLTDYKVDTTLSSTSNNPIANKTVDAEFDAIATAMGALDLAIDGKADKNHNHDSAYDTKGAASSALASAKEYADSAATTAASKVKNDLLNGAGTAYDTLKELGDLIVDNQDAIDALETVAAGKADKTHGHAIADVSGLQTALDGKAASSHGTHVSFSSTAPVMDGTASVGSASTVARSDHKHPTDTSRASKTEFDTHTGNTTVHITSTERTNWNAAKTHADSAHAPSNAQANQNAFSNIKVGSTTIAADTTTDTLELVGSNVTITPDATNDKVTIAVADGSTSSKGLVQLTNSTSSTSTTTAATPSSVKSAYDLANTAKTNAATAQARADSAYTLADGKVDSLSDLGITATATELNYVDGVTSSIQTQLNGKATSGHTHSNVSLGQGYATCSTAASTTAKKASLSNYELTTGGVVSVRFTYSVPASATLNINSKGAKSIYYKNTAIVANVIKGGDIATFIFDGTRYHLISVDRWHGDIVDLQANESKVKQMETVANGNFSLLLAPSDIEGTEYRYAYYADGIYANPSLKRIYADINGTATGVRGVTSGNFLVGNGTGANTMVEKTPAEVLEMIGGIGADNISEQVDTLINNIDNLVYTSEEHQETAVAPLNADTLGGQLPNYYASATKLTPRNLLDNSDFTNPVNQRGQTSYTAAGYTIDRWRINAGVSVDVADNGIKLTCLNNDKSADFYQPLPNIKALLGKKFTFAVSTDKGVFLKTGTIPAVISGGEVPLFLNFTYGELRIQCINANYVLVNIYAKTEFTVKWAALYEGEYTADTLPMYQPKGYGVELAECLRYFERLGGHSSEVLGNTVYVVGGFSSFISSISYYPKRIPNPTVKLYDPSNYRLLLKTADTAQVFTAASVESFGDITAQSPFATITVNLLNAEGNTCWVMLQRADNADSPYIDISAEL